MRIRTPLLVALILSICAQGPSACAQDPSAQPFARVHHPVSTTNASAQESFDQALTLLYAFNRDAARQAFQQAASADPNLAMAYWGIAMSYGPNINVGMKPEGETAAVAAIQRAKALAAAGHAGVEERAFIDAASTRYGTGRQVDREALDRAYCAAMRALYRAFPDDSDAGALFAESAMDLRPWALYTTAGDAVRGTAEIVAVLQTVLARDPQHIGANHFLIHATEASRFPERALPSAFRLSRMSFEPAAAHLVHMPAHTFMRAGYYADAVASNKHASMNDRAFLHATHDREAGSYYGHDLFFLSSAASMLGDYRTARDAASEMVGQDASEPLFFVYLRFHRWSDILATAPPVPSTAEPLRIAVWQFARGMAHAGTGNIRAARADLASVDAANATLRIAGVNGFANGSHQILGVARGLLAAKIAWSEHDRAGAIADLRSAVALQDTFLYIEPPDWYGPVRESLGAALCLNGDFAGAERVFRDDLARNPRNPRSLFGLMTALRGEHRFDDAAYVGEQFRSAWSGAPLSLDDLF